MQPYFFPYAGYYRLFKESDIFVIYDCVQFPRRGWVHRNKLKNFSNDLDWLTLPITKPNYEDRILNINLRKNYKNLLIERFTKFPALTKYKKSKMIDELLLFELKHPFSIVDYIEKTFFYTLEILNINVSLIRSSSLRIPNKFKAEERIINILKSLNAEEYINSPGGQKLYNEKNFREQGINLRFLPEYKGPKDSMLQHLLTMETKDINYLLTS